MLRNRILPALAVLSLLGGCGLQPMYTGGGSGGVARALADVDVSAIEGQSGWLVRNALVDRLGAGRNTAGSRYRLDVRLDDRVVGLGQLAIDTITRQALPGVDPEVEAEWITQAEINDVEGVVAIPGAVTFLNSLPDAQWALVTSAPRAACGKLTGMVQ